jgi:hypothetical protein
MKRTSLAVIGSLVTPALGHAPVLAAITPVSGQ